MPACPLDIGSRLRDDVEVRLAYDECMLSCYDAASCEQYTFQDKEGDYALRACVAAC